MRSIQILISMLLLAYAGINANAQTDADTVRITYKGKGVTVRPLGDESSTTIKFKDTTAKKDIVVKVSIKDMDDDDTDLDSTFKKTFKFMTDKDKDRERRFIETRWLPNFDLGFASTNNDAATNMAFNPRFTKSANINLGIVKQEMNIYKGRFLLSYGFSLNNYYLKYNQRQSIQYIDQQGYLGAYTDTLNTIRKNRVDVHYFTIPLLLEYHSKNNSFNIAAGVEYSFGGNTKSVIKGTSNAHDFKKESDTEIKINPTQINAVLRVGSDHLAVYGRYSITDMYQSSAYAANTNPHQHLFSVGVCLLGI